MEDKKFTTNFTSPEEPKTRESPKCKQKDKETKTSKGEIRDQE